MKVIMIIQLFHTYIDPLRSGIADGADWITLHPPKTDIKFDRFRRHRLDIPEKRERLKYS